MFFAEILKNWRERKGKTQKEMAEILGVSENGYQSYEMGDGEPKLQTLLTLANYFGVSVDCLLGRTSPQPRH